MTKMSLKLEKRLISGLLDSNANSLTPSELSLLLYSIQSQDESGLVENFDYKKVMRDINISHSSVYNALYGLEQKGFIECDWSNRRSFKFFIIDNIGLQAENYKKGYVALNFDFLKSGDFYNLNKNIQLFTIHIIRLLRDNKLKLTDDTLKTFKVFDSKSLEVLSKYFNIDRCPKYDNGYVFAMLDSARRSSEATYERYATNKLIVFCKENQIKYTWQELKDTAQSIVNQIRKHRVRVLDALFISKHLGHLQPKLINTSSKKLNNMMYGMGL